MKQRVIWFLGASVTSQDPGFRSCLIEALNNNSSDIFIPVVDGIGGVGSLYGYASIRHNFLKYPPPDLIIIDYFSGDANFFVTPKRMLENIVRDFFDFLSNFRVPTINILNFRRDFLGWPVNSSYLYDLYLHYGDKFSFYNVDIHNLVATNNLLSIESLYKDGIHTTVSGAAFVANEIYKVIFENNIIFSETKLDRFDFLHTGPRMILLGGSVPHKYHPTKEVFLYHKVDEVLKIDFKYSGWVNALICIVGPDSSALLLEGANEMCKVKTFDRNCYYERPHSITLQRPLFCDGSIVIKDDLNFQKDYSILKKPLKAVPVGNTNKIVGLIVGCP
jgi:hypothetical protein